jgi:hypothetical protein
LFSSKAIDSAAFSLCMSWSGGNLALGGAAHHTHTSPLARVLTTAQGIFYTVKLTQMRVGAEAVELPASATKDRLIVDSGTTNTYLRTALQAPFAAAWKASTGMTFDPNYIFNEAEALSLPVISIVLQGDSTGGGDVVVQFAPQNYLAAVSTNAGVRCDPPAERVCVMMSDAARHRWEMAIFFTEESGGVLGANFMLDHDVLFVMDPTAPYIAIAEANCSIGAGVSSPSSSEGSAVNRIVESAMILAGAFIASWIVICACREYPKRCKRLEPSPAQRYLAAARPAPRFAPFLPFFGVVRWTHPGAQVYRWV